MANGSQSPDTIAVPKAWSIGIYLAGALLGLGSAFIVGPVVGWLLDVLGDAPGTLQAAARLPTAWAIPIMMILGLFIAHRIVAEWKRENGTTTITFDGITTIRFEQRLYVPRERVAEVFVDKDELIAVDRHTKELLRVKADDVLWKALGEAFQRHGYEWLGKGDPREDGFDVWVDGSDQVPKEMHDLLRARARAIYDEKYGTVEDLHDQLQDAGVVVRDRKDEQEFRLISR